MGGNAQELKDAEQALREAHERVLELRRRRPVEDFSEYRLRSWDGAEVGLADLFGERDDLLVVHNMGSTCPYCTMWADGYDGVLHHLENRTAFAVVTPDAPDVQKTFAQSRGWRFRMLSDETQEFTKASGYVGPDGKPWPGVSAFRKEANGRVVRVNHTWFGPGDNFCSVWHFLELLADGAGAWQPKFTYDR